MVKKDAKISPAVASSIKKATGTSTSSSTGTLASATPNSISQPITDLVNAVNTTYKSYINSLTPRLQLIDVFLAFLVLLGILQFVYVILIGNFPFNAFLGGFISCVGQFVLTVSLRLQYENSTSDKTETSIDEIEAEEEKSEDAPKSNSLFESISPERAFGDYIFASLILHFIVYHFIN
ncbi:dolichyl-diphosphooligosaccharide--protein glycosyltransferase subunit Ost2p [[Candida] railenensis]|uniref:Dolichyl-diphosphooligosaccharide--protein glycosyltransferase subunit OST2 n=1 Tax=[Candida] railenensis TaxID=45579 RepID=A0A9P0QQE4_9ASCO|nr:dolichyl-diphosphooligosaccharide--protein glycosyltransferase subunit Ost2p [[Candida] railenensis]